jgi:hypothetical protein
MRVRTQGTTELQRVDGGTFSSYDKSGNLLQTVDAQPYWYRPGMTVTTDELHRRPYITGGPFSLCRFSVDLHPETIQTRYQSRYADTRYNLVRIAKNDLLIPTAPPEKDDSCAALGPAAWNQAKPRLASLNLGQFLAELRDAPSLFRFQLKRFRDLGKGYLNAQFGWKPFLSDLRRWYQSIIKLDQQLARLQKQNGKWQRRRRTILDETTVTTPSLTVDLYNPTLVTKVDQQVMKTETERSWFSGSFRYYIPNLTNGDWGNVPKIKKLWGLEVTPQLVWELLPYSWLVDWFANVGDVISNYTSINEDNMVARQAYVMRHKSTEYRLIYTGRFQITTYVPYQTTFTYHDVISYYKTETKTRVEASPYGFDLSWADFNSFQVSILAALGVSKSRF